MSLASNLVPPGGTNLRARPVPQRNVATEDLVYLFDRMQTATGFDLRSLTDTVGWLEERLGKRLPGALARAGGFPTR
jgi:hydroxymethylglutaryl-CoA lyase